MPDPVQPTPSAQANGGIVVDKKDEQYADTYIPAHIFRTKVFVFRIHNTITKQDHTFSVSVSVGDKMMAEQIKVACTSKLNALIGEKKGYENQPRILIEERDETPKL